MNKFIIDDKVSNLSCWYVDLHLIINYGYVNINGWEKRRYVGVSAVDFLIDWDV